MQPAGRLKYTVHTYVLEFNEGAATTSAFASNSAANTLQMNYMTLSLKLYG